VSEHDRIRASPLRRAASVIGALLTLRALRSVLRGHPGATARERPDQDPSERRLPANPRAERLVAALLFAAALLGFGFTAAYVADGTNPQLLGGALGGALGLAGAACIVAGKLVVPQETSAEQRDVLLDERRAEEVVQVVESGTAGITRRGLIASAAGLAGAGIATAAATPLASLGPDLDATHQTPWHAGVRLVDDQGRPYLAADIQIASFYTALPEHADPELLGAGLVVVRLPQSLIHLPAARRSWAPEGILAYSKICTHAACAISLYRYPTYQPTSAAPAFTCPCHYSTFLPGEGGRVAFGPAGRALPQLPLAIDGEGHLRAAGGFGQDVGPSWWGVHRSQS
jgi:ubiquinol-cytochrome c reductase iron-sulfur subunit